MIERKKWYVISCLKGSEDSVVSDIQLHFEKSPFKDLLLDIKVIWKKVKMQNNNKILKNVFPGYIYLNMILNTETWYLVRNVKNVFGFIGSTGSQSKPVPLTPNEVKSLLEMEKKYSFSDAIYDVPFTIGQTVVVLKHEIFEEQKAVIKTINKSTGIVNVEIIFLNKKHNISLHYNNLKKNI